MKANKSSSEGAKLALSESEAQEYLDLNLDVKAAYLAKPKSDTRSLVEFASDHYFAFSAIEGRPRSVKEYVDCNPDVGYGFRDPKVNTNIDEAKTNIRAFVAKHFQAVVQPVPVSSRKIRTFGCMDLEKYVLCYGDVFRSCSKVINGDPYVIEAARKCVLNHYNEFGKKEGRDGIKGCTPP